MSARIEAIAGNEECVEAAALLARTWGTSLASAPLSSDLIKSLVHSGSCVLHALDNGRVVGVTIGVFGPPGSATLYSLIAAVDRGRRATGIGRALKHHQRDWALERGVTHMIWTFDPLIRRNAHFNLNSLGAEVVEFSKDFYPPMHDAVNRGDLSDRLTVHWDLARTRTPTSDSTMGPVVLERNPDGGPCRVSSSTCAPVLLAGIPEDIEKLRADSPHQASDWRLALREVLVGAFNSGYRITGLADTGHYVLRKAEG